MPINSCGKCRGKGKIHDPHWPWYILWEKMECPACEGTGIFHPPQPKARPKGISPFPPPIPSSLIYNGIEKLKESGLLVDDPEKDEPITEEQKEKIKKWFRKLKVS